MSAHVRKIFCCGCRGEVSARLTNGAEVYPHRRDLRALPFWRCDTCGNFVGCHHKTQDRTRPLGCIPTAELKAARQEIHRVLDPLWQSGRVKRGELYGMIAHVMGIKEYHTAEITDTQTARDVVRIVKDLEATL